MQKSQNKGLDVSSGSTIYRVTGYVEPTDDAKLTDSGVLTIKQYTVVFSSPLIETNEILVCTVAEEFDRAKYHERIVGQDIEYALACTRLTTLRVLLKEGYANKKADAVACFIKTEKAKYHVQYTSMRAVIDSVDARIAKMTKCATIISNQEKEAERSQL